MSEMVPEGWEEKKLEDIASIVMGQSPDSKTYNDKGDGLPFFQGKSDFGARSPTVRSWCSIPSKVAPENSILFSVRAPVGEINSFNKKCCIGRGLAALKATTAEQEFLYQSLLFSKLQFEALGQGSTFEAINGGELKGFPLTIPPLPEQKKIASILISVDEVIEKTQLQIDKLQDLKKGTMNELLTKGIGHTEFKDSELGRIPKSWECVKLGRIAKVTDGAHKTPKYLDSGVRFLRVTDIQSTEINIIKTKYISREEHQELCKRCLPEKGDVLLSKNGTIGITKIINWDWEFSIFVSLALLKIHNKDKVNVEFLDLYLQSPIVRKQIKDRAKQGSVTNLHLEEIRDFDFVIPSTEEQNKISCIVSSIETKIRTNVHKLHQTQSLKKSLMQDLLTGKVRVSVN